MAETKYPLHSQWVRLFNKFAEILNNLKNKSTPLIVDDAYVPPINYERTDLPWSLGSKSFPWKNLYISNKSSSDLYKDRSEVIDVYNKLVTSATKTDIENIKKYVSDTYATSENLESLKKESLKIVRIAFLDDDWIVERDEESGDTIYKIKVSDFKKNSQHTFSGCYKKLETRSGLFYKLQNIDARWKAKSDDTDESLYLYSKESFPGYLDVIVTQKTSPHIGE